MITPVGYLVLPSTVPPVPRLAAGHESRYMILSLKPTCVGHFGLHGSALGIERVIFGLPSPDLLIVVGIIPELVGSFLFVRFDLIR